ncbi:Cof-type HAD-IIB family hydrolase [Oceanobacillus sp. 143]|jgi:5-amino-6-(5-phospho-D-ribitylamino)uracil phosphatase|uniref:Cof-type HAD-IIB family hydrolase n=1 Tax=Oceanobacillus zhaokaii TaxID=2052660 RepID=A0A345PJT3_9BACI|nr:HAD family hydrolase [Oceanobacillus zhaokaii]AXI10263.1 Cof-type HAD-IIB family hydrolase [Oceanobacillus zhaokaii]QGS69328.1 Cof-type HAD-IIB family hydrolase [Oceanobacillus sp. 143]
MNLIAIDLDGTLLAEDGSITEENTKAVRDVQQAGNIVIISSGRSLHDTKQILLDAELECPIITGNGAIVFHNEEILQNLYLEPELIKELIEIVEENGLYFEIYTNQGVYVEEAGRNILEQEVQQLQNGDADFAAVVANKIIDIQFKQNGLTYVLNYHDVDYEPLEVYKIFVLSFNQQGLSKLKDRLTSRKDISLTTSGVQKLEIGNLDASKGNALTFIANYFDVDLEDTVAIGDNLNDLSMFEVAGMSIAMGNAEEIVKKQATHVTKSCEEDGVAYGLREFVLKK